MRRDWDEDEDYGPRRRERQPLQRKPLKRGGKGSIQQDLDDLALLHIAVYALVIGVPILLAWLAGPGRDWAIQQWHHGVAVVREHLPQHEQPRAANREPLPEVRVAAEGPQDGYSRDQYGPAWADVDHNGCDTRNDILARDLTEVRLRDGSRCVVVAGRLTDPYTGQRVRFAKARAGDVQIDHVVSLSEAWRSGAAAWTRAQREAFANDPLELEAATASVNRAKSDHDPDEWSPTGSGRACSYARRVVRIKGKYGLTMEPAERAAVDRMLEGC